jgi:hypothetical protein
VQRTPDSRTARRSHVSGPAPLTLIVSWRQPLVMRTPVPIAGIIGLAASVAAIGLWTIEQLSGQMAVELLTIPVKVVVLAAPLFFLSDLSAFLHGRPRVAIGLALALVALTVCAMAAYLPWRSSFAEHFNNGVYRWYYLGMPTREGDFPDWEAVWSRRIPHMIEAALVFVYYAALITACTVWRLRRVGGAVIGVLGYLLLFFVPIFTGLILWDYDTFLKGIAFDSISMDLFPVYFWHAGDYSIFLYAFMLIFFGVSAAFFYVRPRNAS